MGAGDEVMKKVSPIIHCSMARRLEQSPTYNLNNFRLPRIFLSLLLVRFLPGPQLLLLAQLLLLQSLLQLLGAAHLLLLLHALLEILKNKKYHLRWYYNHGTLGGTDQAITQIIELWNKKFATFLLYSWDEGQQKDIFRWPSQQKYTLQPIVQTETNVIHNFQHMLGL